jgi:two-component system nitrate/nitrite response regulator NarL
MLISDRQSSSPTKVYVLAENRLLRQTLVRLFRKRGDIDVVGDACCSDSAVEDIATAKSDLLLLDCFDTIPASDGWLSSLQDAIPDIKIVLFGMNEDPDFFLRAVRRGIAGYVLKSASAADLLDAIRTVAQGEAACPPKFCKVLFKTLAAATIKVEDERATIQFDLTRRQRQLMSLVAMGLSNKEIAANLNLSEFTVKNHIYRVMKQVDAQSRHEAVSLIGDAD